MGRFSQLIVLTVVQIFVTAGWAEDPARPAGAAPPAGQAAPSIATVAPPAKGDLEIAIEKCKEANPNATFAEIQKCSRELRGVVNDGEKRCQESFAAFNKAQSEFKSACSEAKIGSGCKDAVSDCYEKEGSQEYSATLTAATSALGLQGISEVSKKCPNMTYEKWETSHEKKESAMNKAKDALVEANKQADNAKKDYNRENTRLAKEYNELNKEQAKRALQTNSDKRKATIDAQESIRKVQDAIFNNSMKIQDLRLQISNAYIQKASNITAASQGLAMANFKCTDELQQKLSKMGTISSKAFGNLMANGSSSSNSKKAMWQDCMRAFLRARDQQAATDAARVAALESQIANAEENGKYLQDSLKSVQIQAEEAKKDMGTADQQDQQDYQARIKEIQTAMANNYTESIAAMKTINENQTRLQQDITRASNSFAVSEGSAPPSGASAVFTKASDKYGDMSTAGETVKNTCGCDKPNPDKGVLGSPIANNPVLCDKDGKAKPSMGSLTPDEPVN